MCKNLYAMVAFAAFFVSASAMGALAPNPETFESYPIQFWAPTVDVNGWNLSNNGGTSDIIPGLGGKVLRQTNATSATQAIGNMSGTGNIQTITYDFRITDNKQDLNPTQSPYGEASLTYMDENLSSVLGEVEISTWGVNYNTHVLKNTLGSTDIPVDENPFAFGTWYQVEMIVDFDSYTVKARTSAAAGGWNDWSSAIAFNSAFVPDRVELYTIGGVEWDNISAAPVPEPATMALLGFGGVLALLRRRRR